MNTIKRNTGKRQRTATWVVLIAGLLSFASCSKWLDVRPSTQTTEQDQFSSEQGYIDALVGLYQKMTSNASYGKELTYGTVDVLAQLYENKANEFDTYGRIARYNYTDIKYEDTEDRLTDVFWKEQYSIVAQTNYILNRIDENKSLFRDINFNLVKGETLAIRAMVHFDLLRLYAPSLVALTSSTQKTIPYMTEFTVAPATAGSFQETIDLIVKDLQEAEALLSVHQGIDQIQDNAGSVSLDLFTMYRQNRLNYWAVKGLLARVYLYNNNKEQALKYANEVIDGNKFEFVNAATVRTDPADSTSNIIFSTEHLFSIYHSGLKTLSDKYFKVESGEAEPETEDLFTTRTILQGYYESGLQNYGTDIRGIETNRRWKVFDDNAVYSMKYYVGNAKIVINQRLIPILRLPEIYYIAAESANNIEDAVEYLNAVRVTRLIPELDPAVINTTELLEQELFKEYRKEFYAEGQLWYYYKRKNYATIPNSVGGAMNNDKYVFPVSSGELEFGF